MARLRRPHGADIEHDKHEDWKPSAARAASGHMMLLVPAMGRSEKMRRDSVIAYEGTAVESV